MENIIIKYLQGTATKDEQSALLDYLKKDKANQQAFKQTKNRWKEESNSMISLSTWKAWQKIDKRIHVEKSLKLKWMKAVVSAASILLFSLLIASYLFINQANNTITVQTKHGQNIEVVLPDSSLVHLNANSSISYNPALFSFNRTVDMTGEAFFEVRKKTFKKFMLNVNNVNVTVLGTRFNVNAYQSKQSIDVVLEEGKIEITLDDNPDFRQLLHPGEKAAINVKSHLLTLSHVDTKDYSSWKKGILYFRNSKLSGFFSKLENRYGVRFMMEDNEILQNMNISLTIDNDHLNDVLEVVQLTLPITISTEANTFKVKLDEKRYNLIK